MAAEVEAALDQPLTREDLAAWLAAQPAAKPDLKPVLRRLKQRAYARIATRDLAGLAPLGEVVEA
jgi:glutamate-ammonia-ligase adenylyltransferase